MYWYFEAWQRYVQFSGRASREAFWMFFLVNCLVSLAFIALEVFTHSLWPSFIWKVDAIYSVLIFLPMLSLTVRRLHDINRSAWWLSVILIPAVGMIVLFILLTLPSEDNGDIDYSQSNDKCWLGEKNENC